MYLAKKKKIKKGDFVHLVAVLKTGHEQIPYKCKNSVLFIEKLDWLNPTHSYYC